jgi:predicted HAD superfamily Cof-like phosphohydrolase
MTIEQEQVRDFLRLVGFPLLDQSGWPDDESVKIRMSVLEEEFLELKTALWKRELAHMFPERPDVALEELADALGDILYATLGMACAFGIDLDKVFQEVHRSNMTKRWPTPPHVRLQGHKVLKPPTYEPPDISKCLK